MRKATPYIIIAGIVVLVGILVASGKKMKPQKIFDERITLRIRDKIPYGMSAARTLLPSLFSGAAVFTDDKAPGYWNTISSYTGNQAVVLVAKDFEADEFELNQLLNFIKEGNHAFIIAKTFSFETQRTFGFEYSQAGIGEFVDYLEVDSVAVSLDTTAFSTDTVYSFPGKKYESWFTQYDTVHSVVFGRNAAGEADFIQMKIGTGTVSIHTVPIAFSNYFLLHKNNTEYFQKAFSVIPGSVEKIVWDEYYLNKKNTPPAKKENLFRVLFRYSAFKWGLSSAAVVLLLYMLLFMRRRQRAIPVHQKPKNDSLDFVKTMGRLYFERKDHTNLSLKMAVYFLEHVRTNYKIPTHELNTEFVQILHYKSGYPLQEIEEIVSLIRYLKGGEPVSEVQLARFYTRLESFYQNT